MGLIADEIRIALLGDMNNINVKTFGAKGDGVTDDTVSIQNAINSVASNFNLEFPQGTYIIDTLDITGKKYFNIEMKGFAKPKGDIAKVIFNLEGCSYFFIAPMIVPSTADWSGGRAIKLNNCAYGNISNGIISFINTAVTTSGDFIHIGSNVHHINISNNIFKGAWGILTEDGVGVHDISIIANTFYGCKPYVSADLIEFNQPTNSADHIIISNNTLGGTAISTTGGICIGVSNCKYVTISGNVILDSGFDGIHVEDKSKYITIIGNVISNCNGFCLAICLGVEDAIVEGNILTQFIVGTGKVVFYCCGDTTRKNKNIKISNNTMEGGSNFNTKFCLLMTYCTSIEVYNNLLRDSIYGAYCDSDDGYNSFVKNRLENNNTGLQISPKLNTNTTVEYNNYQGNIMDYVDLSIGMLGSVIEQRNALPTTRISRYRAGTIMLLTKPDKYDTDKFINLMDCYTGIWQRRGVGKFNGIPTEGYWNGNEIVYSTSLTSGQSMGIICKSIGNAGTYSEGRTVTANGTNTLVLSSKSDVLKVGDNILIRGTDIRRIMDLNETALVVDVAVLAGVNLSLAYQAPIFLSLPRLL